ncbi:hypothetical protein EPUS_01447 [Endocarpon pusillum Z07020]|uniref:Uncharacterized protein n=1 Tax=Endocarpon pusillum (strain Z07020 / HMAS-L-300199) TaxID=1263415 RepID=U1I2C7_ENDPU|nr:uncharacterized protein EPUS_01447 [Endocarpon pusillum Z07020]ERF76114.1 hypothetical protein EPUS_01447 [Endocarpon pusillum Z07020]
MARHAATLDALPSELIYEIIIRVPFSKDDFTALQLINRRVYQIMGKRGWMIFNDIAAEQCAQALAMQRLPYCSPFAQGLGYPTQNQLADVCEMHQKFEKQVNSMAKAEAGMLQQGLDTKYFRIKGWKSNVLTGLNVVKAMEKYVQAPAARLPNPNMLRAEKKAVRCREFVECLPISYCLAVRHTTLLSVQVVDYLGLHHEVYDIRHGRGRGTGLGGEAGVDLCDRTMKVMFENNYCDTTFKQALLILEDEEGRNSKAARRQLRDLVNVGQRIQGIELYNITEMLSVASFRLDHHITRRIAEAMEDWDDFASGAGKGFIAETQRTEGGGEEASPSAKSLVESFLDDLTGF